MEKFRQIQQQEIDCNSTPDRGRKRQPKDLIKDVRTRWNSTFNLLERALELKRYLNRWIDHETSRGSKYETLERLRIHKSGWVQVEYLISLLRPFAQITLDLNNSTIPVINEAWEIYNTLFDHLDKYAEEALTYDSTLQFTKEVQNAIKMCKAKIEKYWLRTDKDRGLLYNLATILDPTKKLAYYCLPDWAEEWRDIYWTQFYNHWEANYKRIEDQSSISHESISQDISIHPFHKYRRAAGPPSTTSAGPLNEAQRYNFDPVLPGNTDILKYWKSQERVYPSITRMARDVLAIPIAEVGVERVFSIARSVIRSERGRLQAGTIAKLIITKYIIKREQQTLRSTPLYCRSLPLDMIGIPDLAEGVDGEESELEDLSDEASLYSSGPEDEDEDNMSDVSADGSDISSTNTDTPHETDARISKGKEILIL